MRQEHILDYDINAKWRGILPSEPAAIVNLTLEQFCYLTRIDTPTACMDCGVDLVGRKYKPFCGMICHKHWKREQFADQGRVDWREHLTGRVKKRTV